ncbi:MAG: cytidine deaminase [Bacteroidia bacterium]|nr:cytidine deaminase [Bacteroidia bacterium]NND25875.1 cytidine deaminase [Flavobacteriaceae bacterium]MBT8279813.1 cytidine deaminase [Bacteroidia bacterium]NNK59651.1 cytidine deaminase [Flavobacteriaceae bacterium]NNL32964.1 cytidine deaminase [Flavobacteriaceae bacterium]
MKKVKLETELTVYDALDQLPKDVIELMNKAKEARKNAYAPYSNFSVGAAIRLDNNKIVTGNNQENASYPSGLCAERTAIFAAGANFPKSKIVTMAIIAGSNEKETDSPIPPCGACRQSIAEYEVKQNAPIAIYFMGVKGKVVKSDSLANLLPLIFDRTQL